MTPSATGAEAVLINSANGVRFRLELVAIKDRTFRLRIREAFPLVERFEPPHVLDGDPAQVVPRVYLVRVNQTVLLLVLQVAANVVDRTEDGGFTLRSQDGDTRVVVAGNPFRADFYSDDTLVLSANARGLLRFEHTRRKKSEEAEGGGEDESVDTENNDEPGMWEETFGGNTDSKPHGPQGVSMDFAFVGSNDVFGVPEHADNFNLKDTSNEDPIRLYNLDVFEYELWNEMALYAAVPFMLGHNTERTTGLFWLNSAETWIDVKKSSSGVLGSLSSLVSSQSEKRVDTHWMSESGIIDAFVMLGPRPKDVSRQFGELVGKTPLPPEFSLGYHQCRWNYNDQDDVRTVAEKFDEHDLPMDVMWLDIEHTDGKKYFTWDGRKFSDPLAMVQNLTAVGRKLVTIVDPHIKKDQSYWVHKDCTDLGLYVKDKEGKDYEGWCWPGASYYPDFLNPAARDYFAQQYRLDKYQGSTLDVYTWNDMNEPSVFNGPEVTMPKDMLHMGGVEHRDVHNLYGHLYLMATHAGHLLRADGTQRPFILTRSAFAGSQRYVAIWTGDNTADWGHLQVSVPMCLSLSIAGLSFCGADVGGFFGNPGGELFVRWYQAAAFQPFFRSHAHIDTRRREPWLFSSEEMSHIRDALRLRYSYLPLWYTLFYEGEKSGVPPMRPLFYEFPGEEASFSVEDEHLVGDSLLVHPITKAGVTKEDVYFPGGPSQFWYDIATFERVRGGSVLSVTVSPDRIPVYQRGGTIVPKKERIRRSSPLMRNDPYTLYVALDSHGKASGTLFIDDGKSFKYRDERQYLYIQFRMEGGRLTGSLIDSPNYATQSWLEKVIVVGVDRDLGKATLRTPTGDEETLQTRHDPTKRILVVRKPGVNIGQEWEIIFG